MISFIVRYLFYFSSLFLAIQATTHAATTTQRSHFQQLLKEIPRLSLNTFEKKIANAPQYPLNGYLQYRYYKKNLKIIPSHLITAFLTKYPNDYYSHRLRQQWLLQLGKDKHWQRFLTHYHNDLNPSPARQCLYAQALINTRSPKASSVITQLWLVGKSQHKYCDPVFSHFKQQGLLTDTLRWQRIELALHAGQYSLARYLAQSVSQARIAKKWVRQWKTMHKSPQSQLLKLRPISLPKPLNTQQAYFALIEYGIKRLARRSTKRAYQKWQQLKSQRTFSPSQQDSVHAIIGQRAALNRQNASLHYFNNSPAQEWRIRAALWQQNWPEVQEAIFSLEPAQQQHPRWQYWLGRSYAALNQHKKAQGYYEKLRKKRDYYGFLAADRLNQPYYMNHQQLSIESHALQQFSMRDEIKHLHAFYLMGLNKQARRQAYFLKQYLFNTQELEMMATLAHNWGWHHQAIMLLGKAESWHDLNLRFPVLHQTEILKASQHTGLEPSWLLAITRQESAFNPTARSHAGARGLMQLMPQTARATAKKINRPLRRLTELNMPHRNIQLGSTYLHQVYQRYHNPVLATASYNAGPHRVKRWLPKQPLPADIWIENIPFTETRKYAMNVLAYSAIFDYQRKKPVIRLRQRMPMVTPLQ